MAKFRITDNESGDTFEIEAPDDASDDQVMQYFQTNLPKPEVKAEGPKIGTGQSAILGAHQGASFGFGDELLGASAAAFGKLAGVDAPMSTLYNVATGAIRKLNAGAADQHPWAYHGSQIAAGLAPAVATGGAGVAPAVARAGMATRMGAGAAEGAAYGALHGAGSSEGGIGERAIGAGIGGTAGAVGGAALAPAVDVAGALWRGVSAPVRGMLNPEGFGRQKVAEALMRDRNPSGFTGRGAEGAVDDLQRLTNETGKPLMLADMGGENTRNLFRSAGNMASTGAQRANRSLDARQSNQWRRIEGDMADGLGNADEYATTVGDIVARRGTNARTAYDQANAVETPMTDRLREVLSRPIFSGRRDGANDGQRGLIAMANDALMNEGAQVGLATRTQALHYVKMQIDKQIGAARRAQATGNSPPSGWDVRTLTMAKRDLLSAIDNDAYKAANLQYASESALINAAEDGFENGLRMHTEEIGPMLAQMTPDEQQLWRHGLARAISGKMRQGNVTRDRTENIFSSPDIQNRLRAAFPNNEARRDFQRDLILEARMADTRKAVQGNSTTAKQLMQSQEAGAPVAAVSSLANAAMGRFEPLMNALARGANRFSGLTPSTANSVIDASMSRGGGEVVGEIRNALMRAEGEPIRRAAQVRAANALMNAGGAAAYQHNRERQPNRR